MISHISHFSPRVCFFFVALFCRCLTEGQRYGGPKIPPKKKNMSGRTSKRKGKKAKQRKKAVKIKGIKKERIISQSKADAFLSGPTACPEEKEYVQLVQGRGYSHFAIWGATYVLIT